MHLALINYIKSKYSKDIDSFEVIELYFQSVYKFYFI